MTGNNGQSSQTLAERFRGELDRRLVDRVAQLEMNGPTLSRDDQRALAAHIGNQWLAELETQRSADGAALLGEDEEAALLREALDGLFGADALQPFLDEPTVREIRMNGADVVWVIYGDGRKERHVPLVPGTGEMVTLIQSLARQAAGSAGGERRFDASHPVLDLQLPGGHRLWATMGVTDEPYLVVRRHDFSDLTHLDELGSRGMFPPVVGDLLRAAVRARLNKIIGGGTGTGKTTLLRALCNEIPPDERLIVIEDSPELGLDLLPDMHTDHVPMCKREHNIEGVGGINLADLVRSALRGSPDRVICGETRGHEVLPMLLAMSQGNEGSMSTVHARSSGDVFSRLATYAAMAPEGLSFEASASLIAGALDLVVFLSPRSSCGQQSSPGLVTSIREVTGFDGSVVTSNEVLRIRRDGTFAAGVAFQEETADRLYDAGFDPGRLEEAFPC